jgi:hypothetical protein
MTTPQTRSTNSDATAIAIAHAIATACSPDYSEPTSLKRVPPGFAMYLLGTDMGKHQGG